MFSLSKVPPQVIIFLNLLFKCFHWHNRLIAVHRSVITIFAATSVRERYLDRKTPPDMLHRIQNMPVSTGPLNRQSTTSCPQLLHKALQSNAARRPFNWPPATLGRRKALPTECRVLTVDRHRRNAQFTDKSPQKTLLIEAWPVASSDNLHCLRT